MFLAIALPFFSSESGAGSSAPPAPSAVPDLTHAQGDGSYSGPRPIVGADDILSPDKFPGQTSPTSKEDIASIGLTQGPQDPAAGVDQPASGADPASQGVPDPIADLFKTFDSVIGEPSAPVQPELPEGVDPKSATAQIFKHQQAALAAAQRQAQQAQMQFRQMGLAYDQTVQQQQQQIALMQQQLQQLQQGNPYAQQPQPPMGSTPEEVAAWQSLTQRVQEQWDKQYQPVLEQQAQQIQQMRQYLQQQQTASQQQRKRAEFAQRARRTLEQVVFKPAGIKPADHPEVFNNMLEHIYAIGSKTGQPLAVCAKEAARRSMAFTKAWYGARTRNSDMHQQMRSEPKPTTGVGAGIRGEGFPSQEKLRANGFKSTHHWELAGRPALPNEPARIPKFVLGDGQ